ncbi:MAG: NTP transferase domain-containing protein [Kiritimatiellae bacterium]|nr:NTP transferase domain-containing protein [Kiritimatiellia bacterium]
MQRKHGIALQDVVKLSADRVLNPDALLNYGGVRKADCVLVVLAAGKGTRFGTAPKCVQPVRGLPLGRHSINAFRSRFPFPCIGLVGYAHAEVMTGLGADNIYVMSANPTGGTAFAALEALCVPELEQSNALLVITMGDRIVPPSIFQRLLDMHRGGEREADLTLLSLRYVPPAQHGKGRILRDSAGRIQRIIEQRDIDNIPGSEDRRQLEELAEGNCPLYAVRARTLRERLGKLTNDNAQGQYYFTDLVESICRDGGMVRAVTTGADDPEYILLCSDVTRPADLARLESILASSPVKTGSAGGTEAAAETIMAGRSAGQIASIACQLHELQNSTSTEEAGFSPGLPLAIGISGGRFRIAFMHPDMGRFYGPAWQMPTGAADAKGREQIVLLAQAAADGQIHHFPANPKFREKTDSIPADDPRMYPDETVNDVYKYEEFGTRMAEQLLLSLGYFSDAEIRTRKEKEIPLPPRSLWVGTSMRRPFSLICNAIASLRTMRSGPSGDRIQRFLGRDGFRGLRIASTGNIPQGGFSSSSALTVAVKNALNVLFGLGLPADTLVHLASQAEYGTGVRAGSLDQATEQKGKYGQGSLISSNPRDNYRLLGVFPVPTDRFRFFFPYSVDRDQDAWKWSAGVYAGTPNTDIPTTAEMRKLTGKAAEIAAILCRLPANYDFFSQVAEDLVRDGRLGADAEGFVLQTLRRLPLLISRDALRSQLEENRAWWIDQLQSTYAIPATQAQVQADAMFATLFVGWREPLLQRGLPNGSVAEERGIPLRAMVAYLFVEVERNFRLIHHPERWIETVTRSQRGDCCYAIDPGRLPSRIELMRKQPGDIGQAVPERLSAWIREVGAVPFDYNCGLDDASLAEPGKFSLHGVEGGNFFRGLALIDLAEAMLKRAFGAEAVAVRVNAAGQGDYFQVHVDSRLAEVEEVKDFIQKAFYDRFGLAPHPAFVEPHPGGGAIGVRLDRLDELPALIAKLEVPNPTR